MTSRDFAYWLQGFFEIQAADQQGPIELSIPQTECIQNHLNMVFKHEIDPSHGSEEHQKRLAESHKGRAPGVFPGVLPIGYDPFKTTINC